MVKSKPTERGYIHVYTGNGKGKTTAALGLALRAAGAGKRILIIQFAKGQAYSELNSILKLKPQITLIQSGRSRFIRNKPEKEDLSIARKGLALARKALESRRFDVIILDEACIALRLRLFPAAALYRVIKNRASHIEVVLTGRDAPSRLLQMADLVTEMREVRHYYYRGVPARRGIEN